MTCSKSQETGVRSGSPGLLFLIYKSMILGGPSMRWDIKAAEMPTSWQSPLIPARPWLLPQDHPCPPCRRKLCQSHPHRCCKVLRSPKYRIGNKSNLHFMDFAKQSLQSFSIHAVPLPSLPDSGPRTVWVESKTSHPPLLTY